VTIRTTVAAWLLASVILLALVGVAAWCSSQRLPPRPWPSGPGGPRTAVRRRARHERAGNRARAWTADELYAPRLLHHIPAPRTEPILLQDIDGLRERRRIELDTVLGCTRPHPEPD
jgi:hypothetical protein